jgi:hypothetical protein
MNRQPPIAPILYTIAPIFSGISTYFFFHSSKTSKLGLTLSIMATICMVIAAFWAWGRYWEGPPDSQDSNAT